MDGLDRRTFLAAAAAAATPFATPPGSASASARGSGPAPTPAPAGAPATVRPRRPVVISSGNGLPAVTRAMEQLREGASPTVAVVEGVRVVEDDPNDMTVGYGGLPNALGVVQLDASVMDGPLHKAGAVAALEDIRNPAAVALDVLRRTDHVLLVGAGARAFAIEHGFEPQNLLTDRAREAWRRWRANLNPRDDWLDEGQQLPIDMDRGEQRGADAAETDPPPFTWGTIHCAAVNEDGDLGATTSTSGLSYKLPGRVGDSPIIGAGMYVDNEIGAAGATGRGESVIQSCGAFQVVQRMAAGLDPTPACLEVLRSIASHTRRPDLLDDRGRPNFSVTLYALRKDGAYGSATMRSRGGGVRTFTLHDGEAARELPCAVLFE